MNWSSPAHWPGKPNTTYGPEWQTYFEVTEPLENVTWPLPRNWAGSISTKTVNSTNNTLFFWGFEKSNGSLTDTNSTEPWMIWLAGGPGYSSVASALVENIGPIVVTKDSLGPNNNSWHNIADMFFVDSPVGTGYSTVGRGGYPADEDAVATDFLGFLSGLVKVFPGLATRPLYLVGESYAGRFIPYILKNYFAIPAANRTVTVGKIGCSNPALSEANLFENIPVLHVIETYPQLINYDTQMYDYLREQNHLCKFDLNLTYPQTGGKLPYTRIKKGELGHRLPQPPRRRDLGSAAHPARRDTTTKASKTSAAGSGATPPPELPLPPFNTTLTGKINAFFGCDLRDTAMLYALNFTYPWDQLGYQFDYLDIPYTVNPISENLHPHRWMNHNTTRAAIHAPNNKVWRVTTTTFPWGNVVNGTDPSPPSTTFLDELATNATKEGIDIVWYSGNDDALTTHWSTEVAIQNTTFGGIQGFTVKPNTSWFDDEGLYGGVVRQERGWTYGLLYGAGHQTPVIRPARSFAFIRDFFIGNSTVGLVDPDTGIVHTQATPATATDIPVPLLDGVLTGQAEIYYKTLTVTWPEATVAAFNAHVSSAQSAAAAAPTTTTKHKISTTSEAKSSTIKAESSTTTSAASTAGATATSHA
ncbi:alpha/beta-hydrolase [Mycena maculata]|uniref:Carboxypeptidase n=1 Tax=Mycena maculata TaxID=230809 RepID=A0AAD7IAK8_9AGAR|nr:alpha/beta-hydrolase [Mycena maculata]